MLRWLALGAVPQALLHVYSAIARVRGRSGRVLALQAATTGGLAAGVLLLAPAHGLPAIGWVWLAVHTAFSALVVPSVVRAARVRPAPVPAAPREPLAAGAR